MNLDFGKQVSVRTRSIGAGQSVGICEGIRMKKILLFALVAVAGAANAQTIFYGGDSDGRDGIADQSGGSVSDAYSYDNFNMVGTTVTGLFANMVESGTAVATQAKYIIRTGVANGVQGTVVASGAGAVSRVATGRSVLGFQEFTYTMSGLNIALTNGTMYWFALALDKTGQGGQSFVTTTDGANGTTNPNAIGTPIHDGRSFLDWQSAGFNMYDIAGPDLEGGGKWDLSQGVIAQAVPEPATMAALGLGVAALLRRRNRKA